MTTDAPKPIKPGDVRKGDLISLIERRASDVNTRHEGVVTKPLRADSGYDGTRIWIGSHSFNPVGFDIELLDRPKTPGQVAYEVHSRASYGGRNVPYDWDSFSEATRTLWDTTATAVLEHASRQSATA